MKESSWASLRRPLGTLTLAWVAGLGLAACEKPAPPPPEVHGFTITDKFFDVKSLGNDGFILLGYRSALARSEDGGATWKKLPSPTKRSLTRLSFVDAKHGWGVGHEGIIFATENGGDAWTEQQSDTKLSLFDVSFVNPQKGWAVGDLSTITATGDGGKTWKAQKLEMSMIGVREDMSLAITDPIFYGAHFLNETTGWIVGEFGQIRSTKDGGHTWDAQHGSLLGGKFRDIMSLPTLLCVRFRDEQHGIAVGTYGTIVSTQDGGATWKFEESPVGTPLYDIRWLPDGDTLIVGSSGVVLRGNSAQGWKPATMPPGVFTWISAVDFDSGGHGVAGGGHGLVLTSNDFGKSWEWKTNG